MASWTKLMFLWKLKTFKATRNAKEKTVHGFKLAQQSQFFSPTSAFMHPRSYKSLQPRVLRCVKSNLVSHNMCKRI